MFLVSDSFKSAYPEAAVGVLAMRGVSNPQHHPALAERKAALENELRDRFGSMDRPELRAQPRLQAYHRYYRQFKKSYHVQLQLESIVWKKKSIPQVAALVEAMFMAELKNQLLTAGHDLDVVQPPVMAIVAAGKESYVRINGKEQTLKAGDMFIADQAGVLSSIVYGPDRRTRISPQTKAVIFTVYAPPGIDNAQVEAHLRDLQNNVLLISPNAETTLLAVYEGS